MAIIFNFLLVDLVAICIALLIGLVTYFQWAYTYWARKKVPFIKPKFPFGTSENPFKRTQFIGHRLKQHYDKLKSQGHKHGGLYFFARPSYMLVDPQYIKNVMSRDFQYFPDHGFYFNEKDDPLSANLFTSEGQKWRNLRAQLTPCFTSSKMKMMFQTMLACSDQLIRAMDRFEQKKEGVHIKDVLGCFTTDIIGSCAFGLECNSFENPHSDFRKYGKKIFSNPGFWQVIKALIVLVNQNLARSLRIALTSSGVRNFFMGIVKETVRYREETNFVRQDFMQILIDLKNSSEGQGLTLEELAAQSFMFFAAGFETSSTTLAFCLFELAHNPDIQQRVRDEVNCILGKNNGMFTYDALMGMKYMGQVIEETLRKYPPASLIPRKCAMDYRVPNTNVIIDKGTRVFIPVLGLHYDSEYFPDPEKFNPERFSDENKKRIAPFTYLPFGEGPRICIGARFGLMQIKVGLAALLRNFNFTVSQKTRLPLAIDAKNFIISVQGGIWLDIKKLKA